MNTSEKLIKEVRSGKRFSVEEALHIYSSLSLTEIMFVADRIRHYFHPEGIATYIIDRNINITNICFSFCSFCSFCKTAVDPDAYVTSMEEYNVKIKQLYEKGGNQVLLQGGMHPMLGLAFYVNLFQQLKKKFPDLYIHSLSPSEIIFLAQKEKISIEKVIKELVNAGLDSLPGGGAEILSDRVRNLISPKKASSAQWLEVMRVAHGFGLETTATMMFGHIETLRERVEHILAIRNLQDERPKGMTGFISFIPWTFQQGNTRLINEFPGDYSVSASEYIRLIALSRILLVNIPNIQASWLTVGADTAMLALNSGANDLGSIMLEENVVASTGVKGKLSVSEMEELIIKSGFIPARRNQKFKIV